MWLLYVVVALAFWMLMTHQESYKEWDKGGGCRLPDSTRNCKFTVRQMSGGQWKCPKGYVDTGCSWEHGNENGKLQCMKCECNPGDPKKCLYERRQLKGGKWRCPSGYDDTGCSWGNSNQGEKQCKKCVSNKTMNKVMGEVYRQKGRQAVAAKNAEAAKQFSIKGNPLGAARYFYN